MNRLIGKTIAAATEMRKDGYDDSGWLLLEFTDGTKRVIEAGYGGYTGGSEGEYPTYLRIYDDVEGLIPCA